MLEIERFRPDRKWLDSTGVERVLCSIESWASIVEV